MLPYGNIFADLGFASAAGDGDKDFGDLVATNIRTLCNGLGLDPPEPAASLDTFVR